MEDEGRMVSAMEKANRFIMAYKKVSRVKVRKGHRKEVNSELRKEGPEMEDSSEITLGDER